MITILSDDTNQNIGKRVYEGLCERDAEAEYISLDDVNVGPCFSCGGCTDKTYGKCIHRDDGDSIFGRLARSNIMVWVSPVTWGSYSFKTKRVLDKCALIGDRHYYVKNKELVKKMADNIQGFYGIGIKDHCSDEEKQTFENLVAENIKIMSVNGNAHVLGNNVSEECIMKIVEEISR